MNPIKKMIVRNMVISEGLGIDIMHARVEVECGEHLKQVQEDLKRETQDKNKTGKDKSKV